MSRYAHHFFVCVNERPVEGRPSCGARGGRELLSALQRGLAAHPDLWGRVQITATGCLGPCFDGPSMVVYPEGVWYAQVGAGDVAEIVAEHMLAGRPVERLRYEWPD